MQEQVVLSIDPGREKCGIAVVHKDQGIKYKTIIDTAVLSETVIAIATTHDISTVVIGDGTTSGMAQACLRQLNVNGQKLNIIPVNEYRSTDEARRRYWADHPPGGLKRLIPTSMQVPPVPVDDYVAVILAERYFALPLSMSLRTE
ncbi:hypothetical protein SCACP_32340 [Sporomusa carbonis]|uniref:pre-16S rRNA-processing nuclease YqgF n=1 Tax=Sporomusa carbonis TaxID=3076075 RepID=UPI003A6958C2